MQYVVQSLLSHPAKKLDCEERETVILFPGIASWIEGKNLKLAGVLGNIPEACTSSAMIYHRPYQLLLSSSCQLGQPNGWLKCMCGHPRVKWKLRLWQKMDSCGGAYGLIQRNVIDMLLCFIISPPAPQHVTIALPHMAVWQMSCAATEVFFIFLLFYSFFTKLYFFFIWVKKDFSFPGAFFSSLFLGS